MYVEAQVHSKLSAWFSIDHVNSITSVPFPLSSVSEIYIQLQVSRSFVLHECANIQTFISSLIMLFSFIPTYPQTSYIFMFLHYSYFFIQFQHITLLLFNSPIFYLHSSCLSSFLMGPTFSEPFLIFRYIHFDVTLPHIYQGDLFKNFNQY